MPANRRQSKSINSQASQATATQNTSAGAGASVNTAAAGSTSSSHAPPAAANGAQAQTSNAPGRASANPNARRSVLHFSLREDIAANRGWACDPQDKFDPSRQTMQEWASGRAQMILCRQRMSQLMSSGGGNDGAKKADVAEAAARGGQDEIAALGDNLVGAERSKATPARPSGHIGVLQRYSNGATYVALQDGSGGVRYPSGQLAMCLSSTLHGTYIWCYTDDTPQRLLAAFSPLGGGCCYSAQSGRMRLICFSRGGTLLNEDGGEVRSWRWGQPVSLNLQLSSSISIRVTSRTDISLVFRHPDVADAEEHPAPRPPVATTVISEVSDEDEEAVSAGIAAAPPVRVRSARRRRGPAATEDGAVHLAPDAGDVNAPAAALSSETEGQSPSRANKLFSINVGLKTPKVLASLAVAPLGQSVLEGLSRKARVLLNELSKQAGRRSQRPASGDVSNGSRQTSAASELRSLATAAPTTAGATIVLKNPPRPVKVGRRSGENVVAPAGSNGISVVALPPGLAHQTRSIAIGVSERPVTAPPSRPDSSTLHRPKRQQPTPRVGPSQSKPGNDRPKTSPALGRAVSAGRRGRKAVPLVTDAELRQRLSRLPADKLLVVAVISEATPALTAIVQHAHEQALQTAVWRPPGPARDPEFVFYQLDR